jgi:hypothetical protein
MADEATAAPETPQEDAQTPPADTGSEQKTFDADYVRKLRGEAAAHRKEAQEAKARVEEFENAQRSELERAQAKTTKAEQRAAEAEAKLLRFEVATEKQVPAKLVPLLTGKTREELEAQAALILDSTKPAGPDFDGGPREPAGPAKTPEQEHNDLFLQVLGAART